MKNNRTVNKVLYVMAILYVIAVYAMPVFFGIAADMKLEKVQSFFMLLPFALGILNVFVVTVFRKKLDRISLLNCAVLVKYALIPFYILGGLAIAMLLLLTFTPVVFMIFVGPVGALMLAIIGWLFLLGAAPFSLGYISKSKKEGVHNSTLCSIAAVLQFFFTVDVISLMVLALKEKRFIKTTIAMIGVLVIGASGIIGWIVITIIRIALH